MARSVRLDEDHHVHSVFSDGVDTLDANLAAATELGLKHLGYVDHVRRESTYVPRFVAAVNLLRRHAPIATTIGVEAKLLNVGGELDLPSPAELGGVDRIYVADHQFPGPDGPISPRVVRDRIAAGDLSGDACAADVARATIRSMHRYAAYDLVLAHLFSLLPKIGLRETDVPELLIDEILEVSSATGTIVEVSERWRTPSDAFQRRCLRAGVRVIASTDSHRSADIGRYEFVRSVLTAVE